MEATFFGLKKAFEKGATHVIEIHGDGQYDLNRIIDVEKMLNDDKNIDLILGIVSTSTRAIGK